jgi:ABC-2 type transport system permease protein
MRSVTVTAASEQQTVRGLAILMPLSVILLLFVSVMTGGQALLTSTVEEKSSRVIEVLLSAVSPMQLMAGKLLGQLAVSLLVLGLYIAMGLALLTSFAVFGLINPWLILYVVIFFLILYLVIGSFMMAAGSAVNDMREAQSLMMPIMLVLIVPWVLWMPISRDPNSLLSIALSFTPPINSFAMMLRMASTAPPPWWQVWLSIAIGGLSVVAAVWFAAKVFRIGLLMYGKPPNLKTLIRWARSA